ncbi:hypothetical protein [Streptosporangium roseum]|uniref:hypothetical protein n=1 Tax=Streptosporangium roseum TaxID=2001 RepID=UPI003321B799
MTEEEATASTPCGPDPEVHAQAIREYLDAGFTEVCISQIGEEQDAFFDFYAKEVLPRVPGTGGAPRPVPYDPKGEDHEGSHLARQA